MVLDFRGYALSVGAAAALLAGCGGSQRAVVGGRPDLPALAKPLVGYNSVYSFQASPDGQNPGARVIPFDGDLYGSTTVGGGGAACGGKGCGTVFKVTKEGSETVLHRFAGRPDGAQPEAELAVVNNLLYGTTYYGGERCKAANLRGCGIVFSLAPSGGMSAVYAFQGGYDGANPEGPLTLVKRTLYGTTVNGGGIRCRDSKKGCGVVYSINPSGEERVVYRFKGEPNDGSAPTGNLVNLNGTLYGTTMYGGRFDDGTIFAISPAGKERVVYSAGQAYDMSTPSGLVAMDGVLYGSSEFGGRREGGTVYAVTISGNEHVVHSFSQNETLDGYRPVGRLIAVNGSLYGATQYGGNKHSGYGVVYSMSTFGYVKVLYRFKALPDGEYPASGVSDDGPTLFGTTRLGGSGCYHYGCQGGYGTVYRLPR
ncbi:MAG TPA: choice-of-anchor tandem repeat GloVer-containing protein [Candidatus Cybelea sp.]|jgi:uncharacterized repeat protein (TIGR03803 family)